MNYKEFRKNYPIKEFGEVRVKRNFTYPLSGEKDKWGNDLKDYYGQVIDKGWEIYLEHSCDEWVIGDVKTAEEFSKNLLEAIDYCKTQA